MRRETRGFHPDLDNNSQEAKEAQQLADLRELLSTPSGENQREMLNLLIHAETEQFDLMYDYAYQHLSHQDWPEIAINTATQIELAHEEFNTFDRRLKVAGLADVIIFGNSNEHEQEADALVDPFNFNSSLFESLKTIELSPGSYPKKHFKDLMARALPHCDVL